MRINLKNKKVDLVEFFRFAAGELRKKTGLSRFQFLVPDKKNGNFVAKYSTCLPYIRLSKKELCYLSRGSEEEIILLRKKFFPGCFFSRFLLKINWKIKLKGISVIIPIYNNGEVICLILLTGRFDDSWYKLNYHYMNKIKQEISHCLKAIMLYNQALERAIKNYNNLNE